MDQSYKILGKDTTRERYEMVFKDTETDFKKEKTEGENLKDTSRRSWAVLGYVGQIGFSIAIPIAGGAILGSFLDRELQTYPKMTLGLLIIGIFVSLFSFIKTVQDIIKELKD